MKSRKSLDSPRYGLARVLSKRGLASRSQAALWVRDGRVQVNGRIVRDPEFPVRMSIDVVEVVGASDSVVAPIYLMLNKPRGLVTTVADEQGRDTVYRCFEGAGLPWLAPVGRLDKASEGLLLFSNDPAWAAAITDPERGPGKTYHVQVDCVPDADQLTRIAAGTVVDGQRLSASAITLLRHGARNAWLQIVLDEGRNRQIRRLLAAFDIGVLRLIRVAIGELPLGELPKGQWRWLTPAEIAMLAPVSR